MSGLTERLPKWAQAHITDLTRQIENKKRAIELLKETATVPLWHNHEFYELRLDDEFGNRRYICANNIYLRNAGIEAHILPHDDRITIHFDCDGGRRQHGDDVLIMPDASNSISLMRVNVQ